MHPPSQYQARRLLELVATNHKKNRPSEHVDTDIWARAQPRLLGRVYSSRSTARADLKNGSLGAMLLSEVDLLTNGQVDQNHTKLLEVGDKPGLEILSAKGGGVNGERAEPPLGGGGGAHVGGGPGSMVRVESSGSRMSKISSVPSFGKLREPLSGDSVRLESSSTGRDNPDAKTTKAGRADYEEFGSEALITHVYDDGEDESDIDAESSSRLFREIGPSISVAYELGHEAREYEMQVGNGVMDTAYAAEYVTPQVTLDIEPRQYQQHFDKAGREQYLAMEKRDVVAMASPPPPPPPPLSMMPVNQAFGNTQRAPPPPPPSPPPPPPPPPPPMMQVLQESGNAQGAPSPPPPPPLPVISSVYSGSGRQGGVPPPPTSRPPPDAYVGNAERPGEGEEELYSCDEFPESVDGEEVGVSGDYGNGLSFGREERGGTSGGKGSSFSSAELSRSEYTGYSEDISVGEVQRAKAKILGEEEGTEKILEGRTMELSLGS